MGPRRFSIFHWGLLLVWLVAVLAIGISLYRPEADLPKPQTILLLRDALEQNAIRVTQAAPNQPLQVVFTPFERLPPLGFNQSNRLPITKEQWEQLTRIVNQLVVSANWGLGDPFSYDEQPDGGQLVTGFQSDEFKYTNPFMERPPEISNIPVKSSSLSGTRHGWRVVFSGLTLFLRSEAPEQEAEINLDGTSREGVCFVAQRFRLRAPDGSSLRLSIAQSADLSDQTTRLQAEPLTAAGRSLNVFQKYRSGQYFIWQGQPIVVYETPGTTSQITQSKDGTSSDLSGSNFIITKYVNGRITRLHLLGQATTNVIGARVGGYLPYLDGALKPAEVNQVALTIDPELQSWAFSLLRTALGKLDGYYGIGRQRQGSVTILDSETGAILAMSGFPSYEPDWIERRRILVNREAFLKRSAAFDVHMPGSAVKVLTVALGFLLFGEARAELLPPSDDDKAVRQAFQDAYGVALTEPLLPPAARPSDAAKKRFEQVGKPERVLPDCVRALEDIFLISSSITPSDPANTREVIITETLRQFFDQTRVAELYPIRSRWPIKNADSMGVLRLHALGAQEARFTTLRLAAILATATTGRIVQPYLIESVVNNSGTKFEGGQDALRDINVPLNDITNRRTKMIDEMSRALRKVLLPGGTGWIIRDDGKQQYLGQDDPTTSVINEGSRANSDLGKSGTADYGDPPEGEPRKFPDSIFVYRHGHYIIAVWLEQADKGSPIEKGMMGWDQNPAHKLAHRLVQLIEALEHKPNES